MIFSPCTKCCSIAVNDYSFITIAETFGNYASNKSFQLQLCHQLRHVAVLVCWTIQAKWKALILFHWGNTILYGNYSLIIHFETRSQPIMPVTKSPQCVFHLSWQIQSRTGSGRGGGAYCTNTCRLTITLLVIASLYQQ